MADRTFFTTLARQVADAASDIDSASSGTRIESGSGSRSGSSVASSGSRPASVAPSSVPSGPPQTQALLGSPGQLAAQAPQAEQVRFPSVTPPFSAQQSASRGSGSRSGSGSGSVVSDVEAIESEGTDIRRMLLHLCIPAAVFAGVYNVAPLIAHEKLADKRGLVDRRKLLMASGIAAGVAFVIARLVI